MGIIANLFGFGKKKKKALMAIVMVSLIMSLLCTVLVSSVAAQSVSVSFDNALIEEDGQRGFVVNGTVTGSGLNSQGIPVADTVDVIADIKELPNSKYQKFFSFFLFWIVSQKQKSF